MKHDYLEPNVHRVLIFGFLSILIGMLSAILRLNHIEIPPLAQDLMVFYCGILLAWTLTGSGWERYKRMQRGREFERLADETGDNAISVQEEASYDTDFDHGDERRNRGNQ